MTTIGPVVLDGVRSINETDLGVEIDGWMNTKAELETLRELFKNAPRGGALLDMNGGIARWQDFTDCRLFTQYCSFTSSHDLEDGWYALLGFRRGRSQKGAMWDFRLRLYFLGTDPMTFTGGLLVRGIAVMTNDWSF